MEDKDMAEMARITGSFIRESTATTNETIETLKHLAELLEVVTDRLVALEARVSALEDGEKA